MLNKQVSNKYTSLPNCSVFIFSLSKSNAFFSITVLSDVESSADDDVTGVKGLCNDVTGVKGLCDDLIGVADLCEDISEDVARGILDNEYFLWAVSNSRKRLFIWMTLEVSWTVELPRVWPRGSSPGSLTGGVVFRQGRESVNLSYSL